MADELLHTAYRRAWWALLIRGLLALALGVLILWRPMESIASFALVIAIWALVSGVVQVVHAVELRPVYPQWWVLLLSGVVGIAFGLAAFYYYPLLSLAFAVVWTTWWLFLTGILAIYVAMIERRLHMAWGWTLTLGIMSIIGGAFALTYPPITLAALMGLIAGFAIVSGIVLLVGAFRLTSARREIVGAIHA